MVDRRRLRGLDRIEDVAEDAQVPADDLDAISGVAEALGRGVPIEEDDALLALVKQEPRDLGADDPRPSGDEHGHGTSLPSQHGPCG